MLWKEESYHRKIWLPLKFEDRNLLERIGKQKYGTQFKIKNSKIIILDLIDYQSVNIERRKVGLPTIEDYINSMKQMYGL